MPTRNVNLTEHLDHFVEAGIASGRFSNASEVVREGLRRLEQREQEDHARIEWLRAAAQEGIDDIERGDFIELGSDSDIHRFMQGIVQEAIDGRRTGSRKRVKRA
jgi:antitoxin ParD1/3/4